RRTTRWRRESVVLALVLGLGPLHGAISSCQTATPGQEILFELGVEGSLSTGRPPSEAFETYAGWTVTLNRALAAVAPVYFYEGEAMASNWERVFGIPSAYACPTHAQHNYGAVLGEVLEQHGVDLLGETASLGEVLGYAGTCRSVELHLHPPGEVPIGSGADVITDLDGHTVLLEGTATREGRTVPFVARLTLPDEGLMRIVESISADVELRDAAERPGRVVVQVLLDQWLATVDFDSLVESEGGRFVFTDETQAWSALVRGIRWRDSYRVAWRSE
ncbi:MAG: hypothetical protein QME96_14475, partial [Myxococcota bacterium]|nr:hypothetical protein [Myxococcota bacterium]